MISLDRDTAINRYEQLRSYALRESFTGEVGLGLALFMRSGMATWVDAWAEYTPAASDKTDAHSMVERAVPACLISQVTMLITNMALNVHRGD
jgi:hypothetical protein